MLTIIPYTRRVEIHVHTFKYIATGSFFPLPSIILRESSSGRKAYASEGVRQSVVREYSSNKQFNMAIV